MLRNSLSSRARKHFAGADIEGETIVLNRRKNNETEAGPMDEERSITEIRLPPIEPKTPSFNSVDAAMEEGGKIVTSYLIANC
jgi:hypothetical protein